MDRPIIFSAPMVRALLDGRKTQTRRLAWHAPMPYPGVECDHGHDACPICDRPRPSPWQRVQSGDRLWVREACRTFEPVDSGGVRVVHDAYENLDAARLNLEAAPADGDDLRTIDRVCGQLHAAREIVRRALPEATREREAGS